MPPATNDLGGVLLRVPDVMKHARFFLRLLLCHAPALSVQNMKIKTLPYKCRPQAVFSSHLQDRMGGSTSLSLGPRVVTCQADFHFTSWDTCAFFKTRTPPLTWQNMLVLTCFVIIPVLWGDSSHDVLPGTQKTRIFSNSIYLRHFQKALHFQEHHSEAPRDKAEQLNDSPLHDLSTA